MFYGAVQPQGVGKEKGMMETNIIITQEQQFAEIVGIIQKNRCAASRAVNEATLLTAWQV